MIYWWMLKGQRSPYTHRNIDIRLTGKSLQINIAIDSYKKLNCTAKSKGSLTRGKKENGNFILLTKHYRNQNQVSKYRHNYDRDREPSMLQLLTASHATCPSCSVNINPSCTVQKLFILIPLVKRFVRLTIKIV